jgi:hypothetical protein
VETPEAGLRKMLISDSIKSFQKNFLLKHGIYLEFEKDAADQLQEMAMNSHKSIKQVCEDIFHDYPYGIRLMGLDSFRIPRQAVENPAAYIDNYIRENYKKKA